VTRTSTELSELANGVRTAARNEWARLSTLQRRIDGRLVRTWMPDNADLEYKDLLRKSSSPWLAFGRNVIAQGCPVTGYSSERVWLEAWQRNRMDGRQGGIAREVIGLGRSYGMAIPDASGTGVVMRPLSALNTYAVFDDPWSEYPSWVLSRIGKRTASFWDSDWMILDDEAMYRFHGDPKTVTDMTVTPHGLGYCPVIPISNTIGIDGETESSIEPAITIYQRVVDATFTLQMVQRYGAFPQKWMAGGEIDVDPVTGKSKLNSSVDGLIHASGASGETARFGTFEASNIGQVSGAVDTHIRHLSATLQVPPHYLLGSVVNMSQDGIDAAESGYFRNIRDRQTAMGEGYELWMRTAAAIIGDQQAADDTSSQMEWADVRTRSLGQVADAVQKLIASNAPLELAFALVPGWTKTDVLEAAASARATQELQQLTA